MSDYLQPEFYRFNEDSWKLIRFVQGEVKSASKILDLGGGCGIIGIELANLLKANELHVVELQDAFRNSLEANLNQKLNPATQSRYFISSFSDWEPESSYDLIVSNPPYYLKGHGKLGPRVERNLARSFLVDGWKTLIQKASTSLSENGMIFMVVKKDQRIRKEIEKVSPGLWTKWTEMDDLWIISLSRLNEE